MPLLMLLLCQPLKITSSFRYFSGSKQLKLILAQLSLFKQLFRGVATPEQAVADILEALGRYITIHREYFGKYEGKQIVFANKKIDSKQP